MWVGGNNSVLNQTLAKWIVRSMNSKICVVHLVLSVHYQLVFHTCPISLQTKKGGNPYRYIARVPSSPIIHRLERGT